MRPIIYIDGRAADAIGKLHLQQIADLAARLAGQPVDILTHGESQYHSTSRVVGSPEPRP